MILKICHKTEYYFSSKVPRLVQLLKLYPSKAKTQKILDWKISCNNNTLEEAYQDSLGHKIYNIFNDNYYGSQKIISEGKVSTTDHKGIMYGLTDKVNPLCFLRQTSLTNPGKKIMELKNKIKRNKDEIKFCHYLNLLVADAIKFKSGSTNNDTTAECSLIKGEGVCQDFAHILIGLARLFSIPARYVNGYLLEDDNANEFFTHAWAELFIPDLGWIGFDPSHKKCIDEKYVRISCGYDFIDA